MSTPTWVRWPWLILLFAIAVPMVGIVNLASAAQNFIDPGLWHKQLLWWVGGMAGAIIVMHIKPRTLELLSVPLFVITLVLLVAVLVIGTPIKGAQRWLDLGPMNMQPSELAKLSVMLAVASYFSRFEMQGGYTLASLLRPLNPSRPLVAAAAGVFVLRKAMLKAGLVFTGATIVDFEVGGVSVTTLLGIGAVFIVAWLAVGVLGVLRSGLSHRNLVAPIDIVIVPFVLVLIEPDLGTASIVLAVVLSQILFCGVRPRDLGVAAVGAMVVAWLGWQFALHDYQRRRIEVFMNPEADIQGSGYHAAQSIIAVGSGRLTGKGWTEGTQTQLSFLPENHTDFAFSVWAEEWGFVGSAVLILLFFGLVASMLRSATKATDRFTAILAVGASAMIFWHAFINIGMVIGVLPVVGVTLPLVSYGGSSMVTKMVAIGFAMHAWRHAKS
jgi:rod shape determining protein RodA